MQGRCEIRCWPPGPCRACHGTSHRGPSGRKQMQAHSRTGDAATCQHEKGATLGARLLGGSKADWGLPLASSPPGPPTSPHDQNQS